LNEALQDKFTRFLREYDGGPLEPGFAEVANWALAAFGFDENEDDEDDIKSFPRRGAAGARQGNI
jgi:hypothetical protein